MFVLIVKNKKTGLRSAICRPCNREYQREHYLKNKDYYIEKSRVKKQEQVSNLKKIRMEYLRDHPCVECGESDPVVLEFDHLDRNTKTYSVCKIIKDGLGVDTLLAEIKKCQVLCCNCHRRRTCRQLGWEQ